MGDRRCEPNEGQIQVLVATAAHKLTVEEPDDEPARREGEQVEWILVVWPTLVAIAQQMLGEEVACPCCGRNGHIAEVVELASWKRSEPDDSG